MNTAHMSVFFADVSREYGLLFKHHHGGCGRKYFIESFGSGCAFADIDGDNQDDIVLMRGRDLPGCARSTTIGQSTIVMYHNEERNFRDITFGSRLHSSLYAIGCSAADYDNDGFTDLFVSGWGRSRLFRNNGDGSFSDVTESSGIRDVGLGTSSAWLDMDQDGWLDLYVCHYVRWDIEHDVRCEFRGQKAYCTPTHYDAEPNHLYRNNGDATFSDITRAANVAGPGGKSLGVSILDWNDDGRPDIFVANDGTPNFLFENAKNGHFSDVSLTAGVGFPETGTPKAGMGVDIADYDHSGRFGIAIGNFHAEGITLFRHTGMSFYEDDSFPSGVAAPSMDFLTFGLFFFDYDNDGDKDLFAANGHIQDEVNHLYANVTYFERPLLFRNEGSGKFQEVGLDCGSDFRRPLLARGAAWSDVDTDGDLDILINNNATRACLLRNEGGNKKGNWLTIRLEGRGSNRDALGTLAIVEADGKRQIEYVRTGSSYCSQSSLMLFFGLGGAKRIDRVRIDWPSGAVSELFDVSPNQSLRIVEGRRQPGSRNQL